MKNVMWVTLLFVTANMPFAMDPAGAILYRTTQHTLNAMKNKADGGDATSTQALSDFHAQLKDSNYQISNDASRHLLVRLVLIDSVSGKIFDSIRAVFEQNKS